MKYGQFCPIAKATEVLGERWSVLIVRIADGRAAPSCSAASATFRPLC